MLSRVQSATILGIKAIGVTVETDISPYGLPGISLVGLPNKVVQESKERVRSAIRNAGIRLRAKKVTINLAPALLPKHSPLFDLPIALGLLQAYELIPPDALADVMCFGELSLDGSIRPIAGATAIGILASREACRSMIFPMENSEELRMIHGISLLGAHHLGEVIAHLRRSTFLLPLPLKKSFGLPKHLDLFPRHINQPLALRAAEIAAAGGHHLLLCGAPGTGKTTLAQAIPTLLPPLSDEECLEVAAIRSIVDGAKTPENPYARPFRSPHHAISRTRLLGGTAHLVPQIGEITRAHQGVLFLDEFSEFSHDVLEALRQPLEQGYVHHVTPWGAVQYPSRFTLVAAMNPCPCGYRHSTKKKCRCTSASLAWYRRKLSGPILDRIDLCVWMQENPVISTKSFSNIDMKHIVAHIAGARKRQSSGTNATIPQQEFMKRCRYSSTVQALLESISKTLLLSPRRYLSLLRVARTIADLDNLDAIQEKHVAEAAQLSRGIVQLEEQ